ncbi:unnamed protein product [Prunus armeniaca]|uniref:Protein kinase domain-containing protein n=1 Tax=Prunus armeniaca TaxID=36596 RepID=A0A6J5WRX2_PRUAR|nr:unnamed protein product [Prunus armeniaca]
MHDKMQYDLLVHLVPFVLLLWSSSTTTAALGAETPMAKHNCATHCGNISIPFPFGIGPHKDCYFDEWFEMLEVLNVYANGTLPVNNPISFFCGEYRGQQPANLSGSPFVYSGKHNKFTALSCGYLASVSSEKYVVGGCRSICEGTSISPEDCEIGVNCCQTSIPPHLSVISTDTEDDSRARACKDIYAFLVDQEWFRNNFTASNFSVLKDMDSVPVVLDWSLGLENTSVTVFHRFTGQFPRAYDDPKPYCEKLNATSTRPRLVCSCPRGFEGNPYLGYDCHDIDECTDQNRCGPGAPHCMNYYGTYTCYRHRVGGKTKITLILIEQKLLTLELQDQLPFDQTHLTTLVHGTFGYLDPEYFQSSQFTEKSDVYSFGVVLVELLTGQKPISFRTSQEEGKSLATYFIISMQLNRLFEILDVEVVKGGSKADIIIVANLARRCLNLTGRNRPIMREVTAELEGIQTSEKTSNGEQNYEEVEYVRTESIEPWDVVSSSTGTKPGLEGGPASSTHEVPLLPFMSH